MEGIKQPKEEQIEGAEKQRPPMSPLMVKLVNPVVKAMLLSPFHKGMSRRLMVLSFTGRKTGKRYSTPVGYVREGNNVIVFTHSGWRKNFQNPAPVRMRIQGEEVHGMATLITDPTRIKQMVQSLTAVNGEEMSRRMGFLVDDLNNASPEMVQQATQGTYFIDIQAKNGR